MPASMIHRLFMVLLPSTIAFIAYSLTFSHQAVWDDTTLLQPAVLAEVWGPLPFSVNYFRPLGVWSLANEIALWNGDISGHHIGNALIHGLNTALIAALLAHLLDERGGWAPAALALIFGLHPAMVEGVVFISSRFDLLLTTGLLLALLAESRLNGWLRPVGVGSAFLLAALSKETAAGFPLILLAWQLANGLDPRQRWSSYLAVVLSGCVYLGLRASALDALFTPGLSDVISAGTPVQHLLLVARSFEAYLLLIVWPFGNLTPIHHAVLPISTSDPASWRALFVMVAALVGLGALVRWRPKAGWLGVAALAATLPAMNLAPLQLTGGAFIAERYLMLPMAFVALGLGVLLRPALRWEERPPLATVALGLWAAAAIVTVQGTAIHWYSQETLWRWGLEVAPDSSLPAVNLSERLNANGRVEEGLAMAREALRRDKKAPMAWNNQGQAFFLMGRFEDAEQSFHRAAQLEPETAFFWSNLAASQMEQGKLEAAEQTLLTKALPLDPANPDAVLNLAGVYLKAGRIDKAKEQIEAVLLRGEHPRARSLMTEVQDPAAWVQLADQLRMGGDFPAASAALDEATALGGDPIDIQVSRSSVLIEAGAPAQAADLIRAAMAQAPKDARLPYNMGIAAMRDNAAADARVWFTRAAELDPTWTAPRQQLSAMELPTTAPPDGP